MALGEGMQDKNEVGGGMLYPCAPPLSRAPIDRCRGGTILVPTKTQMFTIGVCGG